MQIAGERSISITDVTVPQSGKSVPSFDSQ